MMSRTVRYMKLLYIVAGILMSNESVCETVDQIQITPRVEVKDILRAPSKRQTDKEKSPSGQSSSMASSSGGSGSSSGSGMAALKYSPTERQGKSLHSIGVGYAVVSLSSSWSRRLYDHYLNALGLRRIRSEWVPWLSGMLNVWAIPKYLLTSSSSYISRKLLLSNDCDMIYNK